MRKDSVWTRTAAVIAGLALAAGVATPAVAAPAAAIKCKVGVTVKKGGVTDLRVINTNGTGNPSAKVHSFIVYYGGGYRYSKKFIPTKAVYTMETINTLGKVRGWQSGTECAVWTKKGAH